MVIRGLVAAACVVLALTAPAQAGAADDCTTDLLVALLSAEGGTEYPIVERTPEGSIVIHPQNIEPAVGETADRLVNAPGSIVTAVGTWVDCVV